MPIPLDENLAALQRTLKTRGTFHPFPLRRTFIPKGPDQQRPLGIPAVRDRVAQEVVRRLLEPIFEPLFHPDSYGFRPGRNCHGKGYDFLGFRMMPRSRRMRPTSEKKFKGKVRDLTPRHCNLDAQVIVRLNRVIRGTGRYFSPSFATHPGRFRRLDAWVRMRLRCMKFKRKRTPDGRKLRVKTIHDKLGLLRLVDFCAVGVRACPS